MSIRPLLLSVCVLILAAGPTFSQSPPKKCSDPAFWSFFGITEELKTRWTSKQIDELIEVVGGLSDVREAAWQIPIAAFQLEELRPGCGGTADPERFEKLITLYSKLRTLDPSQLKGKSQEFQLDAVRTDLNRLVENDQILPSLIFSFDDGPFAGEVIREVPKMPDAREIKTPFGKLIIGHSERSVTVAAKDSGNKLLWARHLTRTSPDRYLQKADLTKIDLQTSPIAVVVRFNVDAERLTLFVRPNGRFVFYRHSW